VINIIFLNSKIYDCFSICADALRGQDVSLSTRRSLSALIDQVEIYITLERNYISNEAQMV